MNYLFASFGEAYINRLLYTIYLSIHWTRHVPEIYCGNEWVWLCGFVQYRIKEEQRNAGSNV